MNNVKSLINGSSITLLHYNIYFKRVIISPILQIDIFVSQLDIELFLEQRLLDMRIILSLLNLYLAFDVNYCCIESFMGI